MTQGALPLDAFSRYKLSLITMKFQQTQTDRKNKMKKSKPTPLDKQRAKRAEVNAMIKKLGEYGDVPIFRDSYDTALAMTLAQAVQPDDEAEGEGDWSAGKPVPRPKE
jgi:hypothetical protein